MSEARGLRVRLAVGVVLAWSLWSADQAAASSFQGLGHLGGGTSRALDVSADGQVVVGVSHTGTRDEAFRWTATTGMVGLGVLSGGSSAANAVSADGSVIVGRSGSGADDRAFRWTAGAGMQDLGVVSDGRSEAFGVSADGAVVVGVSGKGGGTCANLTGPPCQPLPPPGTEQAFRWTAASGMVGLGTLPLGTANGSHARSVSADGSVVVGDAFVYQIFCFPQHGGGCIYFRATLHAFRWTAGSGLQDITGTVSAASVSGISADGSVVVGQTFPAAARWTAGGGFVSLGVDGSATDASADGTSIVGTGGPNSAFLWRQQPGFLKTLLMQLPGSNPVGWELFEATGISDDGKTIVGWGNNPLGQEEGWIARLDTLPTPTELAGLPPLSTFNALVSAVLPLSRSAVVGNVATVFTTILNVGPVTAVGCRIALATPIPATFDYHATDPKTNQTIGPQNTPIDILAGGSQSFVIGFTPTAPFPPTDVRLAFDCVNTPQPAPSNLGISTVLLSASTTPVPDVIALAATLSGNGVAEIDLMTQTGVFAVATANVGTAASITVSVDIGTLPVTVTICQTNPTTGACLGPPAGQVTTMIGAGETPTFGIFLSSSQLVAFDPLRNRAFVRFRDPGGIVRGATSVAVSSRIVPP